MTEAIHELFALHGTAATTSGNDPLPVIDPGAVWLVARGNVDIVAMTIGREGEGADVDRTHLLRLETGQLLFGFRAPPAGHNVLLLGYGVGDAQVIRMPVARLAQCAAEPEVGRRLAPLVDRWIAAVCDLCAGDLAPVGARNIRLGTECALDPGQSAQPQGGVLWIRPRDGEARFMGHDGASLVHGDILFPLGHDAWLTADRPCRLTAHAAPEVIGDGAYWRGLSAFQTTVETVIDIQRTRERDGARRRLAEKSAAARSDLAAAFTNLGAILHRRRAVHLTAGGESDILAACRRVAGRLGIEVREPPRTPREDEHSNPLEEIAKVSRFAFRRVRLADDWYRQDGGPLLGFLEGGDVPAALLPDSPGSYEVHSPRDGTVRRVTPQVAAEVAPVGFMFYRTLPDRALRGIDLLRFASRGLARDLVSVVVMGALGGMLTLATPLAVGHIFDTLIPGSARGQLVQIMLGLLVAAFAAASFQVTRNVALIRVRHRAGTGLQAALWERLMHLPVQFFKSYTAGDLGMRAMGIEGIMATLSASAITSIVTSVFSVFAVGLLFYYSPAVAGVGLALVSVVFVVIIVCGYFQVRFERALEELNGKLAGMLLQFMNGIAKIRVAAAEDRAFAQWAKRFAQQTRLKVRTRIVTNNLGVFNAAFPVLVYMAIYFFVARGRDGQGAIVSTGAFLAFIAAFATFFFGMMRLGSTIVDLMTLVPIYARLSPILEAVPEVDPGKADPGPLRGRIEISNISFRYQSDGPLILEDVSFAADPGEFVALVGPSGSGKSTLLRILLGFERPESGTITYDGFDVAGLDPQRLRRQLGVVLQDGALLPGDIFTNIVGSAVDLNLNDAWEAARLAGFDRDIEEMPMGMHTIISEGAGTLSGGQRQRLMIARALVTKPRIVFFDEATSALDNPTQAIVTESLDRLRATRIVIAHRLSTIMNADRIYVLDRGRIVQSGTYESLIGRPGLFLELVRRQMA